MCYVKASAIPQAIKKKQQSKAGNGLLPTMAQTHEKIFVLDKNFQTLFNF